VAGIQSACAGQALFGLLLSCPAREELYKEASIILPVFGKMSSLA
jgi:hypothetical protein